MGIKNNTDLAVSAVLGQEPKSSDSSSSSDSPSSSSSFLLSSSSPPQHAPLTPTQGDLNQQPPSPADAASTEKLPQLTEAQLRSYDGSEVDGKSSSIYLSIGGIIYDVTAGKSYYGPGGAYSIFAGKVCDRALALSKLEDKELNDSVDGLTKEHMGTLQHWKGFFAKKYPKIALLAKE